MNSPIPTRFPLVVAASLLFSVAMIVLRVGIGSTPWETTDSFGHPMGFNDPLNAEHFRIIISHFHLMDFLRLEHVYHWFLLGMQAMGLWLLLSRTATRQTRLFFALQPVLFPLGVVFLYIVPLLPFMMFSSPMDREGFTDIPFIVLMTNPVWVAVSLYALFRLPGPSLGLVSLFKAWAGSIRKMWGEMAAAVR